MSIIQPVVLMGGNGTRLYPISTAKIPKQFISLGGKGTLSDETLRRVNLVMDECSKKNYRVSDPLFIMNKEHKLPANLSMYEHNVIYEEYANDTAVAVARVSIEIKKRYGDANVIMVVLPADHYIQNVKAFVRDISIGINRVNDSNIVLYGIDPISPETKYGYIIPSSEGVKFKEKPDIITAVELIQAKALWNSGIFAANTNTVLESLQKANILDWIINPRPGKAPSFDVAVLQEHKSIYALHCTGWDWSDVGTWESFTNIPEIKEEMEKSENVTLKDCSNVEVLNRGNGNIVVIGCKDILVVSGGPNILIMPNKGDFNNHLKEIATRLNI